MICSKTSLTAFLLLCARQSSSFSPQPRPRPARPPSSLDYVSASDPAFIAGHPNEPPTTTPATDAPPSRQQQRRRRRRRNNNSSKKSPSSAPPAASSSSSNTHKLHSQRVSELTPNSTFEDVMTAIKRAQMTHSSHDVLTIGHFLLEGVDDHFAYGYKGSLLARFAVAALRLEEYEVAQRAMRARRERFSLSMEPFESAAIVRGLLRLHKTDEALRVIEEELPPIEGDGERLKHRARALGTVASRNFFENEPGVASDACESLAELGPAVRRAGLSPEDLDMPWFRILAGADQCQSQENQKEEEGCGYGDVVVGAMREFPLDDKVREALDRSAEE